MDSLPVEVADATVGVTADATRSGSCSYFAAAETAPICATCYRCYLSSAAVAEAIRAATVPATPVATNLFTGATHRHRCCPLCFLVYTLPYFFQKSVNNFIKINRFICRYHKKRLNMDKNGKIFVREHNKKVANSSR